MQLIASLVFGILIFILGYGLDIRLLQEEHQKLQIKIVAIEKKLCSAKKKIFKKQNAVVVEPDFDLIHILSFLEKAMLASRVKPFLFEPQPIKSGGECSIKLVLKGSYKNLLVFVNDILQSSYLVVIENLILKKDPSDHEPSFPSQRRRGTRESRLKFIPRGLPRDKAMGELPRGEAPLGKPGVHTTGAVKNLIMEVLLSVCKSKLPIDHNSKPIVLSADFLNRDVFKKDDQKRGLHLWPSGELYFLGLIKQKKKVFGVISDPTGNIYQVKVGDKVGIKQSEITAIDAKGIATVNLEDDIKCI